MVKVDMDILKLYEVLLFLSVFVLLVVWVVIKEISRDDENKDI